MIMRNFSRFIPGEEVGKAARWDFGAVDVDGLLLEEKHKEDERAEQAAREEEVRQTAFAEGMEHGRAQAMVEAQRQMDEYVSNQGQEMARQLGAVVEAARRQLDEVEQAAAVEVLSLVGVMAREVLRHELSVNPNVLLPVIREGLGELLSDSKNVQIKLNPLDMDMLQDTLHAEFPNFALAFQADATMTRGGCLIESAGTVIDATVERRWQRTVRKLGLELPWEEVRHDA